MNQVTEETDQNVKCSQNCQKTMNSKNINSNKNAKDPSETTELSISSEEQLKQSLVNKLHINNINISLINGTSEHLSVSPNNDDPEAQAESLSATVGDVNSVQCSENESNGQNEPSSELCESAHREVLQTVKNLTDIEELNSQGEIKIISYKSELQMPEIMRLIQKDLSEPYSIYTYRYFIHNWPKLCFLATYEGKCIGAIVCKLDMHRNVKRGYIAMLAVDEKYRKRNIGSNLVRKAIQVMIQDNADEVVLETEITNKPALKLYENLGFVRDKRLFRYYLNGVDALRLKLWLR